MWTGILSSVGAGATRGLGHKAKCKALSCSFLPSRWEFPFLGDTWAVRVGIQSCQPPDTLPWSRWDALDPAQAFPRLCKCRAPARAGPGRIRLGELIPNPGAGRSVSRGCGPRQELLSGTAGSRDGGAQPFMQRLHSCSPGAGKPGGTWTGLIPWELRTQETSHAPEFQIPHGKSKHK